LEVYVVHLPLLRLPVFVLRQEEAILEGLARDGRRQIVDDAPRPFLGRLALRRLGLVGLGRVQLRHGGLEGAAAVHVDLQVPDAVRDALLGRDLHLLARERADALVQFAALALLLDLRGHVAREELE
jgi:hypothetical protein